jgi:hypothetical protein
VWLLPLAAVSNITMGALCGAAVVRVLKVPAEFKGPTLAAAAFGNSLALPVVLISGVVSAGKVGRVTFTEEDQAGGLLRTSTRPTLTLLLLLLLFLARVSA